MVNPYIFFGAVSFLWSAWWIGNMPPDADEETRFATWFLGLWPPFCFWAGAYIF